MGDYQVYQHRKMSMIFCLASHEPALMLPQVQFTIKEWEARTFFEKCRKNIEEIYKNPGIVHWAINESKKQLTLKKRKVLLFMLCNQQWQNVYENFQLKELKIEFSIDNDLDIEEVKARELRRIINNDVKFLQESLPVLEYIVNKEIYPKAHLEKQFLKWCDKNGYNKVEYRHGKFWSEDKQHYIEDEAAEYLTNLLKEK